MENVSNVAASSQILTAVYGATLKAALETGAAILQLLSDAGTLSPEGLGQNLDIVA